MEIKRTLEMVTEEKLNGPVQCDCGQDPWHQCHPWCATKNRWIVVDTVIRLAVHVPKDWTKEDVNQWSFTLEDPAPRKPLSVTYVKEATEGDVRAYR